MTSLSTKKFHLMTCAKESYCGFMVLHAYSHDGLLPSQRLQKTDFFVADAGQIAFLRFIYITPIFSTSGVPFRKLSYVLALWQQRRQWPTQSPPPQGHQHRNSCDFLAA